MGGRGKAQCNACTRTFSVSKVDSEPPPIGFQTADVQHHEAKIPQVRYQILLCPKCGSEKLKITSTQRPLRRHLCKDCGHRFKTIEEPQRPMLQE